MLLRRCSIIILFCFGTFKLFSQTDSLYKLEDRLMQGDKYALYDIAPFFDNKKEVVEFLGHHRLEKSLSTIAKRIVQENTLFTNQEFVIEYSTTAKQFQSFLDSKFEKITFSPLADILLITPIESRSTEIKTRKISERRLQQLRSSTKNLSELEWVWRNRIDSLIQERSPLALQKIASEYFKERNRYNRYNFNEEEFINLFQLLTGVEIAVKNNQNEFVWHYDKEFGQDVRLNFLIYFTNHYRDFTWTNDLSIFKNTILKIEPLEPERELFELLTDTTNAIAYNAFIKLTEADTASVLRLVKEYDDHDLNKNDTVPIFPYRFLRQLSLLTDYCRRNNIDYRGSEKVQEAISQLKQELPFTKKRQLEDSLIVNLTLENITAFEYWALINEQSWNLTYSVGRILDVFYSKNWTQLLSSKKHFETYLKKSKFFDNLGIIGVCNYYLNKFRKASAATVSFLSNYQTTDISIQKQLSKAILLSKEPKSAITKKEWSGNKRYTVKNLKARFEKITNKVTDSSKAQYAIFDLLSKISYSQIPLAVSLIENYPLENDWHRYSFLHDDFGFFRIGNMNDKAERDSFLYIYSHNSEYNLYSYYLDRSGIDYKQMSGTLNYDKIYELLKFDVVQAFVGGGGGKQNNEVYSLIKLLELTFKTTQEFPNKLCNSDGGSYACYADDRAILWMEYLEKNNLLKYVHNEPTSFNYK